MKPNTGASLSSDTAHDLVSPKSTFSTGAITSPMAIKFREEKLALKSPGSIAAAQSARLKLPSTEFKKA